MSRRRHPAAPPASPEEVTRREAYTVAESDRQAAELVDLPWYTFRDWRAKAGLPAKGQFMAPLPDEVHERRLQAWQQHVMPRQAAQQVGISSDAMQAWARSQGLPSVDEHAALLRDGLSEKDLRHWDAYCHTRTDDDGGRAVGTTRSAFRRWRIRQGLPGHFHTPAFYDAVRKAARAGNPVAAAFLRKHPQPRPAKLKRGR